MRREIAKWNRAVASVIAASRRDADLTQEAFAEKMGWTRDVVSDIETGRRRLSAAELIVAARALAMDPEALFSRIVRW